MQCKATCRMSVRQFNIIHFMIGCISILLYLHLPYANGLNNGLALTPPMGWMHWERYRCIIDCEKFPNECISEDLFIKVANLLISEGYADVGYEYVIIDDCWMEMERDNVTDRLVADQERFPNGIKSLANYIHKLGLKFGLYGDIGNATCAGYPGSAYHMALDAQTFADWGVDYVKLDGCFMRNFDREWNYVEYGKHLNKTNRPMVYSCSLPAYQEPLGIRPNFEMLMKTCNLWRNWEDISDSFQSVVQIMDFFSKNQDRLQPYAGPGHWNDPDMLILGNYGLSYDQSKIQMAVWSILAAPLLISADLKAISPEIQQILQNPYIIDVDQDRLGIQGELILYEKGIQTWLRPIQPITSAGEYSYAVAFVSRRTDGHPTVYMVLLKNIKLYNWLGYKVTDLYDNNKFVGNYKPNDVFECRVNPNGVMFYKFEALNY